MKPITTIVSAIALCAAAQLHAAVESVSLLTAPAVVVQTTPVAGISNVDPATPEIRVTYSKPMQDGSWSWSTYSQESFPEMNGEPRYLADGRTCVLPVKLQPNKFYAIWLNSDRFKNFKDTNGRPAVPYLLSFTTGNAGTASPQPARKFVRIVAGKAGLTLDGKPIQVADLESSLQRLPDRSRTVVELGASSEVPMKDFVPVQARVSKLVQELGFEYLSLVGVQPQEAPRDTPTSPEIANLNEQQQRVLDWTYRQFGSYFDARTFESLALDERSALENRLLDALRGPRSREYYQAIGSLAALRSTNALSALRNLAFERKDKNNRDRWMAVRALGIMKDRTSVPDLIHLVYHGNVNTRWWAQIVLVQITGQNHGSDWQAWGKWWNESGGQPAFNPEIIRWWNGQAEPEKLAESLGESDQKFLEQIAPKTGER